MTTKSVIPASPHSLAGSSASRRGSAGPKRWSWIQFACAFALFGLVAFLHIDPPLDGLWVHALKTLAVAGVAGAIAGRFGDGAWKGLVKVLNWW